MHKRKRQRRRMSPWARRTGLVGLLVGAVLVGFGAIAAWHTTAPIEGDVRSNDFGAHVEVVGQSWTDMSGTAASFDSATHVRLNVKEAYPGGHVDLSLKVKKEGIGTKGGRVTGVQLPGLPTGWTAELTDGCGAELDRYSPANVTLRVSMSDEAELGSAGTFGEGAGVMVTPSEIAPESITCEPYIGSA